MSSLHDRRRDITLSVDGVSDHSPETVGREYLDEARLLNRRAQLIVDREALQPLAPAIRQQRVSTNAHELQTNHECDHGGKFTKLEGSRRGQICEMCSTRHRKYILSCKRCHMLACEDCRRHRL